MEEKKTMKEKTSKKLKKICSYKGSIQLLSGLSIKGNSTELNIGGLDSEVIKNPITGEPYVPGSSLKGKMRSQLEREYGMKRYDKNKKKIVSEEVKPCGCGERDCMICTLFGAHMNPGAASSPTRMIVRDADLSEEARTIISKMPVERGSYLEEKAENLIKRDKGTADAPRFIERVPKGLSFNLNILLQIFEDDDEVQMKAKVEEALQLVELSYLGGSGSRGYGEVKFDGEWKDMWENTNV